MVLGPPVLLEICKEIVKGEWQMSRNYSMS